MFDVFLNGLLHPSNKDIVTTCFDSIFVYMGWNNLVAIHRDKRVTGFDWRNVVLFAMWNFWSIIIIYPDAKFYWANIINCIYLILQLEWIRNAIRYRRNT